MAREHKPSKWDGVIPSYYDALCRHQFRLTFPKRIRMEVNSRMRDDLTHPQASRLFKNGLRSFICKAAGWKHGKKEKRNYWRQMELSNTPSPIPPNGTRRVSTSTFRSTAAWA